MRFWIATAAVPLGAALAMAACSSDKSTGPNIVTTCSGTCFLVRNVSALTVNNVNLSPCDSATWGANRLGTSTMAPGSQRGFQVAAGCWDARVSSQVGNTIYSSMWWGKQLAIGQTDTLDFDNTTVVASVLAYKR